MRPLARLALLVVLPLWAGLAGRAAGQERYALESVSPPGAQLAITVRRVPNGDLEVQLELDPPGDRAPVHLAGPVHLRSQTRLEARLRPRGEAGIAAALGGERPAAQDPSQLTLERQEGDRVEARLISPSGQVVVARGAPVRAAAAPRPVGLRGRLLALGRKGLDEVLGGRVTLGADLPVSDFLHLGVTTRLRLLDRGQLEPEQETALLSAPRSTWIETELEGGARLPFQLPLPLGPAGLAVGIEPGTRLRYRVRELHALAADERPEARRSALAALARRAIDLPLDAAEAEALTLGAECALEGEMSLALRGQLGLGLTTACLGDVVEVGGQARVGGFWRVSAPFRLSVLREEAARVRVRWTRTRRRELGAEARLFLGVAGVDRHALEDAAPPLEYFQPAGALAGAAASQLGKLLRFELRGRVGRTEEDELDLIYSFDLADPAARAAYERAVRGDLTGADELTGRGPGPVEQVLRVVEHEQRRWCDGELGISELWSDKASRALTIKDLELTDREGAARLDVVRAERRSGRDFLFGAVAGSRREANLEVIRELPAGGVETRALRWRLVLRDPRTSRRDVDRLRRLVARWGLPLADEEALPTPGRRLLRSRFGRTRTLLQVDVSPAGVTALLAASPAELREAWARAQRLVDGHEQDDPSSSEGGREARAFADQVARLGAGREDLAQAVSELSALAGHDPVLAAALLELVPRETVRLRAELDGRRADYDGERRGAGFAPGRPLYGH